VGDIDLARYVKRLSDRPKLRSNGQLAMSSASSAYRRLRKAKSPTTALLNDKKLHRDLGRAITATRDAIADLTRPPRLRTRDAILVGAALAILVIVVGFVVARRNELRSRIFRGRSSASEESEPAAGPTT